MDKFTRARWRKTKDFIAGLERLKDVSLEKEYIQLPSGMVNSPEEKKRAYIQRAYCPELVNIALHEANGRIFQQAVNMPEIPDNLSYIKNDVNFQNIGLYEMAQKVINNLNSTTFCGILVDWLNANEEYETVAEKERSGERAIWTLYEDLQILEVLTGKKGKPIKVTLSEVFTERTDYEGVNTKLEVYEARRVLYIESISGKYVQQLYVNRKKNNSDKDNWVPEGDKIEPKINGEYLDKIPFIFFNGKTNNHELYKPRLIDMVETVNSIFKNWTDLEHMLHNICMPVRYATGLTKEDRKGIQGISPTAIWSTVNPESKFGVIDLGGKGLDYVFRNIENKLSLAERIGYVFMASNQKTATQTVAETTGRIITLSDVVESANEGLNTALEWSFKFAGVDFNPEVHTIKMSIKTEDSSFEANNFLALIQAVKNGLARMKDVHKYEIEKKITDETDFDTWKMDITNEQHEVNPVEDDIDMEVD